MYAYVAYVIIHTSTTCKCSLSREKLMRSAKHQFNRAAIVVVNGIEQHLPQGFNSAIADIAARGKLAKGKSSWS